MIKYIYPDIEKIILGGKPDIIEIRDDVCNEFGITTWEIISKKRQTNIVQARVEFSRRTKGAFTQIQIGEALRRHHSTISYYRNNYA